MTATMVGVAPLATWIPARRAARVDPLETLRMDSVPGYFVLTHAVTWTL